MRHLFMQRSDENKDSRRRSVAQLGFCQEGELGSIEMRVQ